MSFSFIVSYLFLFAMTALIVHATPGGQTYQNALATLLFAAAMFSFSADRSADRILEGQKDILAACGPAALVTP